jgi:hypothetical protein
MDVGRYVAIFRPEATPPNPARSTPPTVNPTCHVLRDMQAGSISCFQTKASKSRGQNKDLPMDSFTPA